MPVASWHLALRGADMSDGRTTRAGGAIARFSDIDRRISQPPLDENVVAVHLGGPKRVLRKQERRTVEVDVLEGSFTVLPAREAFEWETFGPIDFAHFVLPRADIEEVASGYFDRDPAKQRLEPVVGAVDPVITRVVQDCLRSDVHPTASRLNRDMVSTVLSMRVLERSAGGRGVSGSHRHAPGKLATWQLRRVIDYMNDHLAEDFDLATLVSLTGLGRARFFVAFRNSMGRTPFAYLTHLRMLRARHLLMRSDLPIMDIAAMIGLEPVRLSSSFRRSYGMSPRLFRAARAA